MATVDRIDIHWVMVRLLRVGERWKKFVAPYVYGPDDWGWGPNSEVLPGIGHFVWRQAHSVLFSLLLGWVRFLRIWVWRSQRARA